MYCSAGWLNRSGTIPKTAVLSGGFGSLIVKRSSTQYTLLRALAQEKKYAYGIVHQHFSAYFLSEDKALFERGASCCYSVSQRGAPFAWKSQTHVELARRPSHGGVPCLRPGRAHARMQG